LVTQQYLKIKCSSRHNITFTNMKVPTSLCSLYFILIFIKPLEATVGGHDLFTSLAQLEVLWHNDRTVVNQMVQTIEKMDKASKALKQ
jgi:hypothetical protein